jgi:CheY-like chemotaxis protein
MLPGQRPSRLLLIDDHTDLAIATAEYLRESGLEVQVAESGEEALKTTTAFRPDVILCDLNLPDMSGFDIARQLRTNADTKEVLFIVHTALAEADIRAIQTGSRASEVDLFLSKPLTDDKVQQIVRLLAARRSS